MFIKNFYVKLFLVLPIFISGCATVRPEMSREEFLNATTRYYEKVTKEQVLSASEKLFRLSDGDDYSFSHTENSINASRKWMAYFIIGAASGVDYWTVTVEPNDGKIKTTVLVTTKSETVAATGTTDGGYAATTLPSSGGQQFQGNAIYDVFWSRMDFLLGKTDTWMTCQASNQRVKQKIVWGSNEALCNSFNISKDETPKSSILESSPTK